MAGGVFPSELYPEPFERDLGCFARAITADVCERLREEGFVVVDNVLGGPWSKAVLSELSWLKREGHMQPNETQFAGVRYVKPHIYECDLHGDARHRVPELHNLWKQEDLRRVLQEKMPELKLCFGEAGHVLKLQCNTGRGGCFPLHFDNPGPPNKRRLTCLYYMNPNWSPSAGGQLILVPFLQKPETIDPIFDRLVMFRSDTMMHKVLPSHEERYVLTWWLDGEDTNSPSDMQLQLTQSQMDDLPIWAASLRNSPTQRIISRSVYEEEYETSLAACMGGTKGCEEMLNCHKKQIEKQKSHQMLQLLVAALRTMKPREPIP